jgi:hypothetical protein
MPKKEKDERFKLTTDFYAADSIRKRIIVKRHAMERGYVDLADFFLQKLVPDNEK